MEEEKKENENLSQIDIKRAVREAYPKLTP